MLIYYRNWRELVFFTWMCNTIFGIWFRVSISGSKYIKNVCIWHLMLWCITHVCNPALTGLYNGCCRHNRGQLSTRHQQMFIEGALWSYLLSYLSPFDQNSANYVYIYRYIYVYRYIYSYIPRVFFPHVSWDWNIYPAIWLRFMGSHQWLGKSSQSHTCEMVRYMLALHLELPLRWRHWSSSKLFVSNVFCILKHCFCTMFDNVSQLVEVTVGGSVFFLKF